MIYFTQNTYLLSIISASIFGVIFEISAFLVSIIPSTANFLSYLLRECLVYRTGIFSRPEKAPKLRARGVVGHVVSAVAVFIKTVIFLLGLYLVCYAVLDGEVRLAVFLSGIVGVTVSKLFMSILSRLGPLMEIPIAFLIIVLRILTLPIRPLGLFFCKILPKFTEKIISICPSRNNYSLDNPS